MQSTLQASRAKSLAMKPTIGELVGQYMAQRGWKARQMAEHVQRFPGGEGVQRQHIESVLKGDVQMPRYLDALAKSMDVTADDLLAGHIKPIAERHTTPAGNVVVVTAAEHRQLHAGVANSGREILQYETGGRMGNGGVILQDQPGLIKSWRVTDEWIQKNVHNFTSFENLAIVTGFGDSMRPLYNPGDPLLVDRGVTKVDFDGIYFFRVGDEGFVKRLQRIPGNGLLAISENKSYRDWTVKKGMDFEVFARVVKVWRGEDF